MKDSRNRRMPSAKYEKKEKTAWSSDGISLTNTANVQQLGNGMKQRLSGRLAQPILNERG